MLSLSKVYEGILKSMQYDVDETGLVSVITPTGTKAEAKVNGNRLVIPTQKRLREGFGEDLQPYHPLCESPSRKGTSPVLQHMQRSVKHHLGFLISFLADQLVKLSLNTDQHKDLPPEMTDLLMKLTAVTDKTQGLLDKLIPAASKQNKLVTVYLKGPGNFKGQKVNRIAVIRFPILDELDSDADKDMVLGIKIPAKQRKALSALLRLIVPFGDDPEEYSAGTVSRVAPFLTVFLQAYHKIATRMNQMINRLAGPLHLPLKPIELFPLEWIDEFPKIYNQIPSLNGNDGGVDDENEVTTVAPAPQAAATPQATRQPVVMPSMAEMFNNPQASQPVQPQQQYSRPAAASAPAAQKQTVAELLGTSAPQMPQMMPQQQMYMQPQQMMVNQYGQPMMQQPMMMPQMNTGGQAQLPWQMQQQQMQMQQQNPYLQVFQQPQQQQMMQQPIYGMPQQQQMWGQQMYQTGPGL
uniref:Uncharacterized protein n=1 Tax=Pseudomonas phage RVTF4 TaxID=3236931 RepID=A0AB39CCR3_9VIRU